MSNDKNAYTQVSTREQAVIMLRSWLTSVGIEIVRATVRGADLAVVCKNTELLNVYVSRADRPSPEGVTSVRSEELRCARFSETHLNDTRSPLQIAFGAFHVVTEKAGYGKPMPLDRGQEPNRKFSFEEDGWLVPFRHTEFRRAPNPPPAKYAQYKMILERQAYLFYVTNTELCERNATSLDDLKTLSYAALVNFCGHHERPEGKNDENEKILTKYLKQRFAELRKSWISDARRRAPVTGFVALWSADADHRADAGDHHSVANFGGQYGEAEEFKQNEVEESIEDLIDRDELTNDDAYALRTEADEEEYQRRVKRTLSAGLAAMPHDEMVEKLLEVSYSKELDRDTKRMAARLLVAHCKKCSSCSNRTEVHEELAGVDAGSL